MIIFSSPLLELEGEPKSIEGSDLDGAGMRYFWIGVRILIFPSFFILHAFCSSLVVVDQNDEPKEKVIDDDQSRYQVDPNHATKRGSGYFKGLSKLGQGQTEEEKKKQALLEAEAKARVEADRKQQQELQKIGQQQLQQQQFLQQQQRLLAHQQQQLVLEKAKQDQEKIKLEQMVITSKDI